MATHNSLQDAFLDQYLSAHFPKCLCSYTLTSISCYSHPIIVYSKTNIKHHDKSLNKADKTFRIIIHLLNLLHSRHGNHNEQRTGLPTPVPLLKRSKSPTVGGFVSFFPAQINSIFAMSLNRMLVLFLVK